MLVVEAEGAEKSEYVGLIAAVGLTPTTRLKIVDTGRRTLSAGLARSIDKNVENALARRPDVLQAYAAEKASEAKLRAARAEATKAASPRTDKVSACRCAPARP